MTGHQKYNIFVLTLLLGRLLGGWKGSFLAQNWPKNQIFSRYTAQTDPTQ